MPTDKELFVLLKTETSKSFSDDELSSILKNEENSQEPSTGVLNPVSPSNPLNIIGVTNPSWFGEAVKIWKEGLSNTTGYEEFLQSPGYKLAMQPLSETVGMGKTESMVESGADTAQGYYDNFLRGLANAARFVVKSAVIAPQFYAQVAQGTIVNPLFRVGAGEEASTAFAEGLKEQAQGLLEMGIMGVPGIDKDWLENLVHNLDMVIFGKMMGKDIIKSGVELPRNLAEKYTNFNMPESKFSGTESKAFQKTMEGVVQQLKPEIQWKDRESFQSLMQERENILSQTERTPLEEKEFNLIKANKDKLEALASLYDIRIRSEGESDAFKATLEHVVSQLKPENDTQKLMVDLATEALKEGNVAKAVKYIKQFTEKLPEETKDEIINNVPLKDILVEKMQQAELKDVLSKSAEESAQVFEDKVAEEERIKQSNLGGKKLWKDLNRTEENQQRFTEGDQGKLLLEKLDRLENPPVEEAPGEAPTTKDKKQLEMLTEKTGQVKKKYVQQDVEEPIGQKPEVVKGETKEKSMTFERAKDILKNKAETTPEEYQVALKFIEDKVNARQSELDRAREEGAVNKVNGITLEKLQDMAANGEDVAAHVKQALEERTVTKAQAIDALGRIIIGAVDKAKTPEEKAVIFKHLNETDENVRDVVDNFKGVKSKVEVKAEEPMAVQKLNEQPVEAKVEAKAEISEIPHIETSLERQERILHEAQHLGLSRKGKTIDHIEKEIKLKKEMLKAEEAKLAEAEAKKESKVLPKKLLLPMLKKVLDKIYSEKRGFSDEDRAKAFKKYENDSPEQLRKTIDNIKKDYDDIVVKAKAEAEAEAQTEESKMVKERKEASFNDIGEKGEEKEQIGEDTLYSGKNENVDLSKVKDVEKQKEVLYDNAYHQLRDNPITLEEWKSHINKAFPGIKDAEIDKMWSKAVERHTREMVHNDTKAREDFLELNINDVGKVLRDSLNSEFGKGESYEEYMGELIRHGLDPKIVADTPQGVSDGIRKGWVMRQLVNRGSGLLDFLDRTLAEAFGNTIRNMPNLMAELDSTDVKIHLESNKRSNAWIKTYVDTKTGIVSYKKLITLHIPKGASNKYVEADIVHEIEHILVMRQIKVSPAFKAKLQKLIDTVKATLPPEVLERLKWMEEHKGAAHKDTNALENELLYALTTPEEFVSQIHSSDYFRDYIAKVKYTPSVGLYGTIPSVMSEYISLLKKNVFGKRIENNVLEEGLRLSAALREIRVPRTIEDLRLETEEGKIKTETEQKIEGEQTAQAPLRMKATPKQIEDMLDTISEMTGESKFRGKNLLKDAQPPIWNPRLKSVVMEANENTRRAHQISFTASNMIKFLKSGDVSPELKSSILESDAAGKLVGYDKLSPGDKVKFDSIRNTLDYIVRDQMKQLYIEDSTYKQEKKLGRVLTQEEKNLTIREADVFIKKHYASRVMGELESLTKDQLLSKVKETDIEITGKETKGELLQLMGENTEMQSTYFPRYRFGNQALSIKDRDGRQIYFGTFDSTRERGRAIDYFVEHMGDMKYDAFDMRERFKNPEGVLFAIHNAHMLESMLKANDATSADLRELSSLIGSEFLKKWAGGRFAHRNVATVAGYETNVVKALHKYLESFPKSMVQHFRAAKLADSVSNLPEHLQQRGQDIVDFTTGKKWKEGSVNVGLRSALFSYYMMVKLASGFVNFTQRAITTMPKAIQIAGFDGVKAAKLGQEREIRFYQHILKEGGYNIFNMKPSFEALDSFKELSYDHKQILKNLIAKGDITAMRTHEIVEGSTVGKVMGFFMSISEKSNRLMSAFTGLELGAKKGLTGKALESYTKEFIDATQWLYDKANRAPIARGNMAPVMLFKSFMLNDINFMKDIYPNKTAFGVAVASRLALGGVGGIYGAGAFMTVLNLAMSSVLGHDDWELSKKEFKDKFPRFVTDGLPALVGISGSSMFGSSEMFGTAMTPPLKAWWKFGKEYQTLGKIKTETWRTILPSQLKHLWQVNLKERFQDEDLKQLPKEIQQRARFLWKNTPKEQQTWEKVIDILGFATETPAQFYESVNAIKSSGATIRVRKTEMAKDLANAIADKNYEEAKSIREKARKKGYALSSPSINRFLSRKRYADREN